MSTRGFVGFKVNSGKNIEGNLFGMYNHFDSYYSCLGLKMLEIYKNKTNDDFKRVFNIVEWRDADNESSNEDLTPEELMTGNFVDENIYNQYYFLNDSVFCEYGYVYNLKNDTLELYRGFFSIPQNEDDEKSDYYTHKVYTIDRNSDFEKIKDMFITFNSFIDEKDLDMETLYDGKYIEEIFMEIN